MVELLIPRTLLMLAAVLSISIANLSAQENIRLQGKIMNDSLEDSYLHIINLNLGKGTVTNSEGAFTIPARLGDTLYVSALQFEPKRILVDTSILSEEQITVLLTREISELEEVQISDIDLSGRLGSDFGRQEVEKPFDQTTLGFAAFVPKYKTKEERHLAASSSGFGIGGLINLISGRTKMLKKHVAVVQMEMKVKHAQYQLNDSIYTQQLHIPVDLIDDFAYFVFEDKPEHLAIAKQEDKLKLLQLLLKLAPVYRERKGLED